MSRSAVRQRPVLGTPTTHNGRLVVDSTLAVSGRPDVFAIGDCAAIAVSPGSELICPQLAQVAIQSGRHAAAQIMAGLTGRPLAPFSYRDKGIMATIGRRAAVAQLPEWARLARDAGMDCLVWSPSRLPRWVQEQNDRLRQLVVALLELDVRSAGHLRFAVRRPTGFGCGDAGVIWRGPFATVRCTG